MRPKMDRIDRCFDDEGHGPLCPCNFCQEFNVWIEELKREEKEKEEREKKENEEREKLQLPKAESKLRTSPATRPG